LALGEDLFFQEHLVTTKTSSAVVQFRDRSTLEVGPNATVIINRSVYNPVESVSEKTITVVSGAFRFVSGVATSRSETDIRTPVGTLGIRGSIVIGVVSPQGDVVIIPVQGQPTWTAPSGSQNLRQGGALVATRNDGKAVATPVVPASLADLVRQVIAQLGVTPPALQTFSKDQQSNNAKLHTVSVTAQDQLQPTGKDTAPVLPLDPNGASAITTLIRTANTSPQAGSVPASADQNQATDMAYLANLMKTQIAQHDQNAKDGIAGVTTELSTVLTPAQLIEVGASLASVSPTLAADVAASLATLLPDHRDAIVASLSAVVSADPNQVVTAAVDAVAVPTPAVPTTNSTTSLTTPITPVPTRVVGSPH
jgi:hypothetical protein